jgi:DNA-binding GntR family transcriptional regulator
MKTTDRLNRARSQSRLARRNLSPGATTLAEQAYELIKDRLISARYVPGQFLQEATVCADLKLGRTPVHQALHRLQLEGLLEIIPRKGILVKSDSLSEIFTALEVRALVEPYCAAQAAEKATPADIDLLRSILEDYAKLRDTNDRIRLMELDRRFHSKIASIGGNPLLVDFLRPIHERMSRMWFLPHWQNHDFGMTGIEHEKLFKAIARKDARSAHASMAAHVESLRRRIVVAER